jgi:hypothetical protein
LHGRAEKNHENLLVRIIPVPPEIWTISFGMQVRSVTASANFLGV